jgi:pyruvate dehydrogenase (quinone)
MRIATLERTVTCLIVPHDLQELEAVTDPNVPPLPPHISLAQAKAFASSVLKGDAEALGFLKQTVKDAVENYLPHKK